MYKIKTDFKNIGSLNNQNLPDMKNGEWSKLNSIVTRNVREKYSAPAIGFSRIETPHLERERTTKKISQSKYDKTCLKNKIELS